MIICLNIYFKIYFFSLSLFHISFNFISNIEFSIYFIVLNFIILLNNKNMLQIK